MRLSTSTNLFAVKRSGGWHPMVYSVKACYDHGFNVQDANFCFSLGTEDVLAPDNWKDIIGEVVNVANDLGVTFSQSHLPFYNVLDKEYKKREYTEKLISRAIEASAMLGVPWAVVHPGFITNKVFNRNQNIDENYAYFTPHLNHAKSLGVGLALENMFDGASGRRFCAVADELRDLVDAFGGDSFIGACWDFGHANMMGFNQVDALKLLGKRLKALHVADNTGLRDDHLAPFFGNVPWEDLMKTLVDIDYQGDFTYEAHGVADRMPEALRRAAVNYVKQAGDYLIRLANDYKNNK